MSVDIKVIKNTGCMQQNKERYMSIYYTRDMRRALVKAIEESYVKVEHLLTEFNKHDKQSHLFRLSFDWLLDDNRRRNVVKYYPALSHEIIRRQIKALYRSRDGHFADDHMWTVCGMAIKNVHKA